MIMDKDKSKNLMSRIREGDKEAHRKFYDIYRDNIFKALYFMTQSFYIANEILYRVFEKILYGNFDILDNLNRFVWKMTKDSVSEYAGDYRKTLTQHKEKEAAATIDISEQGKAFDEVMWRLGQKDREIILMHMLFDYTFQEIADDIGFSVSKVEKRYYKAIKMFKEKL